MSQMSGNLYVWFLKGFRQICSDLFRNLMLNNLRVKVYGSLFLFWHLSKIVISRINYLRLNITIFNGLNEFYFINILFWVVRQVVH